MNGQPRVALRELSIRSGDILRGQVAHRLQLAWARVAIAVNILRDLVPRLRPGNARSCRLCRLLRGGASRTAAYEAEPRNQCFFTALHLWNMFIAGDRVSRSTRLAETGLDASSVVTAL
jgi:hypothetical protein